MLGGIYTKQPTVVEVFAKVIRADGTEQNLGLVSAHYSWRHPFRKLAWPFRRRLANWRIKRNNRKVQ